jgi:hypothetical protein
MAINKHKAEAIAHDEVMTLPERSTNVALKTICGSHARTCES